MLNPYQQVLVKTYAGGEFAYVQTVEEAKQVGDTLFVFLFLELSTAEDCDSVATALDRVYKALHDIAEVEDALGNAEAGGLR